METQERGSSMTYGVEGWRAPSQWPERLCCFFVGMLAGAALTVWWALK